MRLFALFLFLLTLQQNALCQGVSIRNGQVRLSGFGKVNLENTIEHWAVRERAATTGELNLQVELITEICGLNNNESTKLQLAAKTVSQRRLVSGRKQMRQFIYESQLVSRDADTEEMTEAFDDVLTPFRAKRGGANDGEGVVVFQTRFEQPLNERPLWIKMVRSTLSPVQFEKYEDHYRKRNSTFIDASIDQSLAFLDAQVFLSFPQRLAIRTSVSKAMHPTVKLERPSSIAQADNDVRPWFANRENLKPLLRASQMTRLAEIDEVQKAGGGVGWSK